MAEGNTQGRPISWAVVAIILVGFTVGGLGLITGPQWWLFWTGAALAVIGAVVGWVTGIMEDVH